MIARTEARAALLGGAMVQVRAAGLTGTKVWLSLHDQRVRDEHDHADGQRVDLAAPFEVGGFPMDRPHDPTAPPHLTINCRCGLAFNLDTARVLLGPGPNPRPGG